MIDKGEGYHLIGTACVRNAQRMGEDLIFSFWLHETDSPRGGYFSLGCTVKGQTMGVTVKSHAVVGELTDGAVNALAKENMEYLLSVWPAEMIEPDEELKRHL